MNQQDEANLITTKFKHTRKILRDWQSSMLNLKTLIGNTKLIIQLFEVVSEYIDLSLQEWNFKALLQDRLLTLLQQQKHTRSREDPLNGLN